MKLRTAVLLAMLPAAALAGAAPSQTTPVDPEDAACRDRIHAVREERGLPRPQREIADAEKPLMIWAVDRREAGCAVMVVKGNAEDMRPLPLPDTDGPLLRPAR